MSGSPGGRRPPDIYEDIFVSAMFAPLADVTLRFARPKLGQRVLDLACGTGIVARRVAPMVGRSGAVVAVDLRPGMIAKARSLPPVEGAAIQWREGDATALDLPDAAFDLVLCQQGLQFFTDKSAAAHEIRRVLVPDGALVAAVWRDLEHQSLFRDLTKAEAKNLSKLGLTFEDVAAPFLMGDPAAIEELLGGAGLRDVRITAETLLVRFPSAHFVRDVEMAYASVMPQFIEDPAAFDAFVAAVETDIGPALRNHIKDGQVEFRLQTHMVVARR